MFYKTNATQRSKNSNDRSPNKQVQFIMGDKLSKQDYEKMKYFPNFDGTFDTSKSQFRGKYLDQKDNSDSDDSSQESQNNYQIVDGKF